MSSAIRVRGLGKRYRLGAAAPGATSFREALAGVINRRNNSRDGEAPRELWALRELDFSLSRGEVVGVVGRNGAGKSTLLKILSRITEPTCGRVELNGRVSGLLELGTGFHPELSGRENVFLSGALMGMSRDEIRRRFDAIAAFAEVDGFLDTPLKRYSSGMYLRLAFAVAAHLEPEILVVDEVLAVGDAAFQKKCLGKMGQVAGEGRTVLFVSHNAEAVRGLCSRALWLEQGRLREDGPAATVLQAYLQSGASEQRKLEWPGPESAPGNERVRLRALRVRSADDPEGEPWTVRSSLELECEYWDRTGGSPLSLSVLVQNGEGQPLFNTVSFLDETEPVIETTPGLYRSRCRIPGNLLNAGSHRVEVMVLEGCNRGIYRHPEGLAFEIHDVPEMRVGWYGRWPGAVRPRLNWRTERVDGPSSG